MERRFEAYSASPALRSLVAEHVNQPSVSRLSRSRRVVEREPALVRIDLTRKVQPRFARAMGGSGVAEQAPQTTADDIAVQARGQSSPQRSQSLYARIAKALRENSEITTAGRPKAGKAGVIIESVLRKVDVAQLKIDVEVRQQLIRQIDRTASERAYFLLYKRSHTPAEQRFIEFYRSELAEFFLSDIGQSLQVIPMSSSGPPRAIASADAIWDDAHLSGSISRNVSGLPYGKALYDAGMIEFDKEEKVFPIPEPEADPVGFDITKDDIAAKFERSTLESFSRALARAVLPDGVRVARAHAEQDRLEETQNMITLAQQLDMEESLESPRTPELAALDMFRIQQQQHCSAQAPQFLCPYCSNAHAETQLTVVMRAWLRANGVRRPQDARRRPHRVGKQLFKHLIANHFSLFVSEAAEDKPEATEFQKLEAQLKRLHGHLAPASSANRYKSTNSRFVDWCTTGTQSGASARGDEPRRVYSSQLGEGFQLQLDQITRHLRDVGKL